MNWTSEVTAISKNNGILFVVVTYTRGEDTIVKSFDMSTADLEGLNQRIKEHIERIDKLYTFADTLKLGVFDITNSIPTK